MITYNELNAQNHKITEISNIFLYLIKERAMCDTKIACDLFYDYVQLVNSHLDIEDKQLYTAILRQGKANDKKVAENFMSGSREIKRIFRSYVKNWYHAKRHELVISDYDSFQADTEEVFKLVLNRVQDETERLYPLIRSISGDTQGV